MWLPILSRLVLKTSFECRRSGSCKLCCRSLGGRRVVQRDPEWCDRSFSVQLGRIETGPAQINQRAGSLLQWATCSNNRLLLSILSWWLSARTFFHPAFVLVWPFCTFMCALECAPDSRLISSWNVLHGVFFPGLVFFPACVFFLILMASYAVKHALQPLSDRPFLHIQCS